MAGAAGTAAKPYTVEPISGHNLFSRRPVRRYGNHAARDHVFNVKFVNGQWDGLRFDEAQEHLHNMWQGVLHDVKAADDLNDDDLVRIHIDHEDLNAGSIKVNLSRLGDMNPGIIMDRIGEVLQSKQNWSFDDSLEISVGVIKLPRGGDRCTALTASRVKQSKFSHSSERG